MNNSPSFYAKLTIFALAISAAVSAPAVTVDNFVPRIFTNTQGTLLYRLFIPTNYSTARRYPIVLFLHGAGERGSDNRLQLTGQTGELVFASEANQLKYPSFMVAPQCPTSGVWADATRRAQVLGLMNALTNEFSIDPARLYITGLSMGGIGSWDYISQFPIMYAAAIPMSGSGDSGLASRIIQIPIWNFHAANDGTVNVSGSRTMINAVRRAGGNAIYTEYASGGHVIWTPAYATPILMDWVYAQKRGVAATNAPILTITNPTAEALFKSTNIAELAVSGTASDGNGSVNLVTWTNFQANIVSGTAAGTSAWQAGGISLNSGVTNFILVIGRGTSWYTSLGGNTTLNDTLRVIFPPVITQQPASQIADQGNSVSFTVAIAANRAPLPQYQWRFNGQNLVGKTNAGLTLSNVQITNAGIYSVQVSNLFGPVISSNATLVVNRRPVAGSQSVSVNEDTGVAITLSASDPDGDPLTYTAAAPLHGTLSGVAPNLVYLPSTNYNGPDSFTFRVNDGRLDSLEGLISITVLPVNDRPVARSESVLLNEDTTIAITLEASDADGDTLTYTLTAPAQGTLSGTPPNLVYRPATNYFGPDSFTFKVNDGLLDSELATVSISVASVNDAPFAVAKISPLIQISAAETNLLVLSPNNSNATVVLDASFSSDVENDPLQYSWIARGDGLLATGVLATNTFAIGEQIVELVVSDGTDRSTNTIRFEVISGGDAAEKVISLVDDSALARRQQHSLISSLNAGLHSFDRGSFGAGLNQLQAFQNKVRAQVAPDDSLLAETLIEAAQAIIDALREAQPGEGP